MYRGPCGRRRDDWPEPGAFLQRTRIYGCADPAVSQGTDGARFCHGRMVIHTPGAPARTLSGNRLVLFARRNRNIETHTDQPGDRDTARPRRCLSERRLRSTVLYPLPSASLTRSVSVGSHPETNPPRTRMMYYNREILKPEEQFKKYYSHLQLAQSP